MNDVDCPICYESGAPVTLECSHAFCASCILRQLHYRPSCALCRKPMIGCKPSLLPALTKNDVVVSMHPYRGRLGMMVEATDGCIEVISVEDSGRAHRIGFRKGDTLLGVNGIPCVTIQFVLQTLHRCGSRIRVTIRRRERISCCIAV